MAAVDDSNVVRKTTENVSKSVKRAWGSQQPPFEICPFIQKVRVYSKVTKYEINWRVYITHIRIQYSVLIAHNWFWVEL